MIRWDSESEIRRCLEAIEKSAECTEHGRALHLCILWHGKARQPQPPLLPRSIQLEVEMHMDPFRSMGLHAAPTKGHHMHAFCGGHCEFLRLSMAKLGKSWKDVNGHEWTWMDMDGRGWTWVTYGNVADLELHRPAVRLRLPLSSTVRPCPHIYACFCMSASVALACPRSPSTKTHGNKHKHTQPYTHTHHHEY